MEAEVCRWVLLRTAVAAETERRVALMILAYFSGAKNE